MGVEGLAWAKLNGLASVAGDGGAARGVSDRARDDAKVAVELGDDSDGVVNGGGEAANGGSGTSTTSTTSSPIVDASSKRDAAASSYQDSKAYAGSNDTTQGIFVIAFFGFPMAILFQLISFNLSMKNFMSAKLSNQFG